MEYKIWRHFIQILSFRNDLVDIIKPFMENLKKNNDNQTFDHREEKHIPFLQSLSYYQIEVLYKCKIITKERYTYLVLNKKELSTRNTGDTINSNDKIIMEIIKDNKLEEMQRLIREKGIATINPITTSFNEVEKMSIPIIHYCVIQKAIQCFKYLLINGIEDPTITMKEQNPEIIYFTFPNIIIKRYKWDCMSLAMYYGVQEIMMMLEDKNIQIGNNPGQLEAAILSYRDAITEQIIARTTNKEILKICLITSSKNNNIKVGELLIKKGVDINAKDFYDQKVNPLFLIKKMQNR